MLEIRAKLYVFNYRILNETLKNVYLLKILNISSYIKIQNNCNKIKHKTFTSLNIGKCQYISL